MPGRRSVLAVAAVVLAASTACGKQADDALAELTKAGGPVERAQGEAAWAGAAIGTRFHDGDGARTGDGTAQLTLVGGAILQMDPHSVLRFGNATNKNGVSLELGAVEISGGGQFVLPTGTLDLAKNGGVRISARDGGGEVVKLLIGDATVTRTNGETVRLLVADPVTLPRGGAAPIDAGVPVDAGPLDAPVDAITVDAVSGLPARVAGSRVQVQVPGAPAFVAMPEGAGAIPPGSKVKIGEGSHLTITSGPATYDLAGGAQASVDTDGALTLTAGSAVISTTPGSRTIVAVPGGSVIVGGAEASSAGLGLGGKDTKVTVNRGSAAVDGGAGAAIDLHRGETVTLARGGGIRVVESIPNYFDIRLASGESPTVHDPRPPTAVQITFGDKCPGGGVVEVDSERSFRTPKVSAGSGAANVFIPTGVWMYRVRCTSGTDEGAAVASGRIAVTRDGGRRPLPRTAPTNVIDADGRAYTISYQNLIPTVKFRWRGASGSGFTLHLATGGKDQPFTGSADGITVAGTKLHEGSFTYWIDRGAGGLKSKVSNLKIDFDNTAPQVYIESPDNDEPWGGSVAVKGAVLPGWTASVDGIEIPQDKQGRFAASAPPPSGRALAIRLAHPKRGVHLYLRRQK